MSDDIELFNYFSMIVDDVITMPFNPRNFDKLGEGIKYQAYRPQITSDCGEFEFNLNEFEL